MSEILRKAAHIGVGCFALLFAVLPPAVCLALAIVALIHNAILLPRYARLLWREKDHRRGYSPGVIAYSVTLVLLCTIFWNRPDLAACGWGVLAFGDGIASLTGRSLGGPRLPWNREKSWVGFAAFAFTASAACFLLASFVQAHAQALESLPHDHVLLASSIAGLTGAIVESLPLSLDDNISAPLAAAAMFALVESFDLSAWSASMPGIQARAFPFLALSVVLGLLAWGVKTMSASGFLAGVVLAFVAGAFGGPSLFAALVAFWLTAQIATRMGWRHKASLGIAQSDAGRRRARHAVVKLSIPALLAIVARASSAPRPYELAAVAALMAAACDTVATEIGQLSKEKARRLPLLRPVPAGTPGAMTLLGWSAGIIAALLVFLVAWAAGGPTLRDFPLILGAATGACLVESAIGAFLIPRELIGKSTLNFVLSAVAAWLAWVMAARNLAGA